MGSYNFALLAFPAMARLSAVPRCVSCISRHPKVLHAEVKSPDRMNRREQVTKPGTLGRRSDVSYVISG